jgi:hypothetical protein
VTGLGMVSPIDNSVEASWQALIAGHSGAGPITRFDTSGYTKHHVRRRARGALGHQWPARPGLDVIRVRGDAVADQLRIDARVACSSMLELFEHDDCCRLAITNPSRPPSNGRDAAAGSSLRTESARIAAKPAIPTGVIGSRTSASRSTPPMRFRSYSVNAMRLRPVTRRSWSWSSSESSLPRRPWPYNVSTSHEASRPRERPALPQHLGARRRL